MIRISEGLKLKVKRIKIDLGGVGVENSSSHIYNIAQHG
tara:strand:+ start:218 stop:334 length:117 start_codon:yes stop_codon:yes gene_type:complete